MSLAEERYNMPVLNAPKSDSCLVKRFPYYLAMKTTVPVKIYNLKI